MRLYWILREYKEPDDVVLEEADPEKYEEIRKNENYIAYLEHKGGKDPLWIEVLRDEDDTFRYGVVLIISDRPFTIGISKGHKVEKIEVNKKKPLHIEDLPEDVKEWLIEVLLEKYFRGDAQ